MKCWLHVLLLGVMLVSLGPVAAQDDALPNSWVSDDEALALRYPDGWEIAEYSDSLSVNMDNDPAALEAVMPTFLAILATAEVTP